MKTLYNFKKNNMKNIWLLPTDKTSRLVLNSITNNLFLTNTKKFPSDIMKFKNIYITSDEEIKKVDWFLNTLNNKLDKCDDLIYEKNVNLSSWCKKIILTTDPQLIQDGVQAIDDKFLEWFVKNPSCEEVEVNKLCYGALSGFSDAGYKIIIPKEEAKKDLEKEMFELEKEMFELEKEMFELEQELDIPSHLRWHNSKPKQKTLEEVAKKKYPMFKGETYIGNNKKMLKRAAFIAGAKWQQEQDKKLYSEEEVKFMLYNCCESLEEDERRFFNTDLVVESIIKQFKKK